MSAFYADAAQIRQNAVRTATLATAASEAEQYAETWTPVPADATGDIFRNFRGTVVEVTAAVGEALEHLRQITAGTAHELFGTADLYESTDQSSAATSDAQLRALSTMRGGGPRPV